MSATEIDNMLYDLWLKAANKYTSKEADRIIEPLNWYIGTGRASTDTIRALLATTSRQRTAIISRLAKCGCYDDGARAIKEYLHIETCCI